MTPQELASQELNQWRQRKSEELLKATVLDEEAAAKFSTAAALKQLDSRREKRLKEETHDSGSVADIVEVSKERPETADVMEEAEEDQVWCICRFSVFDGVRDNDGFIFPSIFGACFETFWRRWSSVRSLNSLQTILHLCNRWKRHSTSYLNRRFAQNSCYHKLKSFSAFRRGSPLAYRDWATKKQRKCRVKTTPLSPRRGLT